MKMKKLAVIFLAGVLGVAPAHGVTAADFDDGQNMPDISSAELIGSPSEPEADRVETVPEGIFSVPEDAADVSDTPVLVAINDRFIKDGIRYKEIAPGKVQIQDGSAASGMVVVPAEITIEETGKTYTVVSLGEDAFYQNKNITGVTFPDTIVSIGPWAFQECESLTGELKLPGSLEIIDENAFYSCAGITGIIMPDSLKSIGMNAFYSCTGLTGLTLPEGLESIGENAFYSCTGLTGDLMLPDSLVHIGDYAFYSCGFTGSLTLPSSMTGIGNYVFQSCGFTGELQLPAGLTSIGEAAFYNCGFTGRLILPESLVSIGGGAFMNCNGFTGNLILPKGLTVLEMGVFIGCTGFNGTLTLPDGIVEIGLGAFVNCGGITGTVILPDTIKEIGLAAFYNCTFTCEAKNSALAQQAYEAGCKNVTLNGAAYEPSGSSEPSLPNGPFEHEGLMFEIIDEEHKLVRLSSVLSDTGENLIIPESVQNEGTDYRVTEIKAYALSDCNYTGELRIPEGITSIGEYAFAAQEFTGSLILPEGLTSVGDFAFWKCSSFIGELRLPESLTSIGDYAFYKCDGFTGELVLPEGLTSIGVAAFCECSGFTGELILSDNITHVGNSAFADCNNIEKIHVGSGLQYLTVYSFPECEEMTTTSPRVQLLIVERSNREELPLLLWDGREDVLSGAVGSVVEDITINGDITIEEGAEITITEGRTVTVAGSLTNGGTLLLEADASVIAAGAFTDNGTVAGSGTVVSFGKPELDSTKTEINGNKVSLALTAPVAGAEGYDYIISHNPNCLREKDYLLVNKNKPYTNTTFRYLPKGVCYAAVHAWVRNADGKKVFSPWSKLVKLKITSDMPSTPKIKKVQVSGSTVTVTYTKSVKAAGYDLVLGKKAKKVSGENRPVEYGSLVRKITNGNTVTATFQNVPKGTYYAGLHAWNRSSENKRKVFSKWSNVKKVVVK
ncbi:leucine-rich repeat protein [Blautia schinkii]|nr:leucine-rich repeat protein [Blautia schinkii]